MTDNEIIKYLEQAIDEYNKNEIFVDNIRLDKLSLDIIYRQKAEIENLTFQRDIAIKDFTEFAQRAYIGNPFACQYCVHSRDNGHTCLWKAEHEEDKESCLGRYFEYNFQKMAGDTE